MLVEESGAAIPRISESPEPERRLVGPWFAGEPKLGHYVVVQGLSPTAEEVDAVREAAADIGTIGAAQLAETLPKVVRSVVIVSKGGQRTQAVVDAMSPDWQRADSAGDPTPPARGIAVAWLDDDQILIGIPAASRSSHGGLWHTRDHGRSWQKVKGFANATSLFVEPGGGGDGSVLVAESFFEGWDGGLLRPHAPRVRRWRSNQPVAPLADPPPYGSRSEIEFCGSLHGSTLVRIDNAIFHRRTLPLWRTMVRR